MVFTSRLRLLIIGLWLDPNAGREGSWVAETRRLDETVDRNRGVPHRPEHEEVDGAVLFLHKDYEPPTFRALDPWELQIEHICRSIPREPAFYGGSGATRTDCKRGLRDSLHVP